MLPSVASGVFDKHFKEAGSAKEPSPTLTPGRAEQQVEATVDAIVEALGGANTKPDGASELRDGLKVLNQAGDIVEVLRIMCCDLGHCAAKGRVGWPDAAMVTISNCNDCCPVGWEANSADLMQRQEVRDAMMANPRYGDISKRVMARPNRT